VALGSQTLEDTTSKTAADLLRTLWSATACRRFVTRAA